MRDLVPYYEHLRRMALTSAQAGRHGLGLLLSQGLVSWMRAWARCSTSPPKESAPRRSSPGLAELPAELTQVLVSMALGACEEVRA